MSFYHGVALLSILLLNVLQATGTDVSAGEWTAVTIAFCVSARINEIERQRRKREEGAE